MKIKLNEKSLEQTRQITQRLTEIKNYHLVKHSLEIAKKVNNFRVIK